MIATANSMHNQLAAYSAPWSDARGAAMQSWELEGWIRVGLSLLDLVRTMDEHWSDQARQEPVGTLEAEGREIGELYRAWVRASSPALRKIRAFRQRGIDVAGADAFEEEHRKVSLSLAVDVGSAREAERQLQAGEGRTLQEVRDELRGRHGG